MSRLSTMGANFALLLGWRKGPEELPQSDGHLSDCASGWSDPAIALERASLEGERGRRDGPGLFLHQAKKLRRLRPTDAAICRIGQIALNASQ
jgi:hypothetical protein